MGLLLKEALKCLCRENRWSYAVFWKIGYRNPTLLVWEEYYYEPTRDSALPGISGIESTESLLKEWGGLWGSPESQFPQLGYQVEDRVCLLIKKMMKNNQVHVVGEGIVGRTAFMGNHLWILQENSMNEGYPSEVLTELYHQFSASIQTIAVIPVLPHGVIQLGSTLAIVENTGFVNAVKSLFAQLGVLPGALLSDNYIKNDPDQKIGASTSLGRSVSAHPAINSSSQVAKFTPFISASCSQEISTSQSSGLVSQPSYSSITQGQGIVQANTSSFQTTPGLSPTAAKSLSDLIQIKVLPVVKPNLPLKEQLETGAVEAQVILSSPDEWLNQWATPYDSSSRFNNQPFQSGSSCNSLSFMEQQILAGAGAQEPVHSSLPASNNTSTSQLRSSGGTMLNSLKDSATVSLITRGVIHNTGNDHQMLTSNPRSHSIPCRLAESNSSCPPQKGLQLNSSDISAVPISNHENPSDNKYALTGVSHQSHPSTNDSYTKWTTGKQIIENDLFQALNITPVNPNGHVSRCQPMPDFLHDRWVVSGPKHDKGSPRSQNLICEDARARPPSGDDLFGILGLDFKSEQPHGCWNDFLIHGADTNMQNVTTDVSACITQMDADPNCYAVNDGISESGIFSETGPDHLLDAVVSKVHSGAKQNSDDDVSCWTTVRNICGPSVRTDSCTSGLVSSPDQKLGKLFSLPPTFAKAQVAGSNSFRSGCVKDNAGELSQISSMYGSQISLLGEDCQSMKLDNSISTAQSMRPDKTGKSNRKRLRPGESPRPRPKDRQMIQDRVKELRDIVPNGAKCSIDSLLERTIKHMLFLQSVTKHADKLKQTGESKIFNKEGGSLLKDNFEGGATWAFEVGSQSMVCPIIVEDLNPPRQMLVEMLCEERGFFLEIADIIRGMGLTILKGVMEARNDKVWVRFTVEANRDVTRMEIFMSLVHLLEQAVKSSTAVPKGTDNGNMMIAHNTFHQASIPATGPSNCLQ